MQALLIKTMLASRNGEIIRMLLPVCIKELTFSMYKISHSYNVYFGPYCMYVYDLPYDVYKEFYEPYLYKTSAERVAMEASDKLAQYDHDMDGIVDEAEE